MARERSVRCIAAGYEDYETGAMQLVWKTETVALQLARENKLGALQVARETTKSVLQVTWENIRPKYGC